MKTENVVVLSLILVAVAAVTAVHVRYNTRPGKGYYELQPDGQKSSLSQKDYNTRVEKIEYNTDWTPEQRTAHLQRLRFSWPRTIGIWVSAFFTLAILSFLYKDNPLYKIAEHAFVGVSAAYWMVVGFWTTVVPNLLGKLFPGWIKFTLLPGLDVDDIVSKLAAKAWAQGWLVDYEAAHGDGLTAHTLQLMNLPYWLPMILGIMLLWRLAPKGAWIARWPLAFILGSTAGIRLTGYLESDFIKQIQATLLPLIDWAYDAQGKVDLQLTLYHSMNNVLVVGGVLCGLVYFFFSLEHKGFVGRVSRVGIWVLMITFGAGFGFTVMGRIALLVGRFEFLAVDWLNIAKR